MALPGGDAGAGFQRRLYARGLYEAPGKVLRVLFRLRNGLGADRRAGNAASGLARTFEVALAGGGPLLARAHEDRVVEAAGLFPFAGARFSRTRAGRLVRDGRFDAWGASDLAAAGAIAGAAAGEGRLVFRRPPRPHGRH